MRRRLACVACVLLMATLAAAQDAQRVYVPPQSTPVSGSHSGLVNAMCLDPTVLGAPSAGDPITKWERPDVILVHKLRAGQVIETQQWAHPRTGTKPWVRFEGASDEAGRVALWAILAVAPEPDITYRVEFTEGTAAARPQEVLTGQYLARLDELQDSYGVIARDLHDLRAAFPPEAPLTRLVREYAQCTLYPGMSRDVAPDVLARGTRRFVGQIENAFQAANPDARPLLALFLAGMPTLATDQRAFFERHNVALPSTAVPAEQADAVEQFRRAYGETVLQACARWCWGEDDAGADGLAVARQGLERLAEWRGMGLTCDGPNLAYALGPAFSVTFQGNQPQLSRATDLNAFSLPDLATRLGKVHKTLADAGRRRNLDRELHRLGGRLAKLDITTRLPADFSSRSVPDQCRALVLLGEQLRGVPLEPALRTLLHDSSPLAAALRVALAEDRWLIDVQNLDEQQRQLLESCVADFERVSGIRCTLLVSESSRRQLAIAGQESVASAD